MLTSGYKPEKDKSLLIIIPCFNRPQALEHCLESLAAQSCRDFEVVVVDDSSEPSLGKKMRLLTERFSAFASYVRSDARLGLPEARNRGLGWLGSHRFVLFLDDDCVVPAGLVSSFLEAYGRGFDGSVAAFVPRLVPTKDIYLSLAEGFAAFGKLSKDLYCNFNVSNGGVCSRVVFGHACSFFRAEVFRKIRFENVYRKNFLREETDLFMQLTRNGRLILFCPTLVVYHHNVYPQSGCKISRLGNEVASFQNHLVFVSRFFPRSALISVLSFGFVRLVKMFYFTAPRVGFVFKRFLMLCL